MHGTLANVCILSCCKTIGWEDSFLKRKDLWILLGIAGLAVILILAGYFLPKISTKQAGGNLTAQAAIATEVLEQDSKPPQTESPNLILPNDEPIKVIASESPSSEVKPEIQEPILTTIPNQQPPKLISADAYLLVQIGKIMYDPIPLLGDNELSVMQADGRHNVIGFTKSSIFMKSSTCDNQSCVHQGNVTLENISSRVLQNMIICLPNEVILSLLTPREAQAQWDELYGVSNPAK